MVLLPDSPEHTAIAIAKKINKQLVEQAFQKQQHIYELCFSIGISISRRDDTPSVIINRVDKADYRAKITGDEVISSQIV